MDGNYYKEMEVFWQHNQKYIQFLQMCPLNHHDVHTVYLQCYLPTVSYLINSQGVYGIKADTSRLLAGF